VFNHNQSGNQLEVQIEIFSVNGQLVKKINETLNPEGHRSEPINWNGKKDNGGNIDRGFYVYRLTARNEDGSVAKENSKLIYVK
jgi:flagellar hook assembly protein FlgD